MHGEEKMKSNFDAQNREAARIILEDPQRYGGVMLEWALLLREGAAERLQPKVVVVRRAGETFQGVEGAWGGQG
jgi:hypothetical protein